MDEELVSGKEIFRALSDKSVNEDNQLRNLLDITNDVIFIWDEEEGCLYTQGTRSVCTNYQKLRPTQRPQFSVRNVSVNESGTRAVLWGPQGVAIMDLPWRCGPKLEYQDGKPQMMVRCRTIEQLNMPYDAQVVQVRWHPCSTYDSSLAVLSSDNSVHHFDTMPHDIINVDTFHVGNRPFSRQKTLAALGETAVDFCFPPIYYEAKNQSIGCPHLVLRGNGDVLLVFGGKDDNVGQVLTISPLPQDNCLNDACAIVALAGKPPCVVIATTGGVIYHTLLVPLDVDQIDVKPEDRKYRLLVIESVAIDGGLLSNSDDLSSFPIRLFSDPAHNRRYFIVHTFGVYSVLFNVGLGVDDLLQSLDVTSKMPASVIEYLICSGNPILGTALMPYSLVAFDSEEKVITVPLRRFDLPPIKLFSPEKDSPGKSLLSRHLQEPYEQKIEKLLQEARVMPQFTFPKSEVPNEQLLALFVRIGELIRQVTVPRYKEVRSLLNQRIKIVQTLKDLQLQELKDLEASRQEIQLAAEEFAEKVQSVSDTLEDHKDRVHRVVRLVAEANPGLTDAEVNLQSTLQEIEGKLGEYESSVEKLKKNSAYQDLKITQNEDEANVTLNQKQIGAVRECLSVLGENIAELVRRVNNINEVLGVEN